MGLSKICRTCQHGNYRFPNSDHTIGPNGLDWKCRLDGVNHKALHFCELWELDMLLALDIIEAGGTIPKAEQSPESGGME